MTATSRQLVGKLAMTVLKMRPKLGHIFTNAAQMVTKRPVCLLVTISVQHEQKLIVLMMGTISTMILNFGP